MTKRTARTQRTQAKNGAGPAPLHLVEPMLAGMTTTRQHLLAWVHAHGLAALDELFREEAVALAGPKARAFVSSETAGKRLQFLKEAIPSLTRVAVLWSPDHPDGEYRNAEATARRL